MKENSELKDLLKHHILKRVVCSDSGIINHCRLQSYLTNDTCYSDVVLMWICLSVLSHNFSEIWIFVFLPGGFDHLSGYWLLNKPVPRPGKIFVSHLKVYQTLVHTDAILDIWTIYRTTIIAHVCLDLVLCSPSLPAVFVFLLVFHVLLQRLHFIRSRKHTYTCCPILCKNIHAISNNVLSSDWWCISCNRNRVRGLHFFIFTDCTGLNNTPPSPKQSLFLIVLLLKSSHLNRKRY